MSTGRRVVVAMAMAVAVVLPACGGDDSAAAARQLRRQQAGDGLAVKGVPGNGRLAGNVATLDLSGAGLDIVEPDGDTSGRTGHYVVFVNREPVAFGAKIPVERDVIETPKHKVTLTGFTAGSHKVSVVLADGAHHRIGQKAPEVTFGVSGPTVRVSALAKSPAKQPVILSVAVESVGVVAPDGPAAGGTGHFDVFIDREPTAAGQPVPVERGITHTSSQTIALSDVGGGAHEIWVVLVKGDETPFDPMVADKVNVAVG